MRIVVIFLLTLGAFASPSRGEFRYVHKVPNSQKLIIFVHGLWGDPRATFAPSFLLRQSGPSWMDLMRSDKQSFREQIPLSRYSTATLGYPAGYTGRLSTHRAASNLLVELYDSGILHDESLEVYFIAHSLGGLVVKSMILNGEKEKRELLVERTKAVFLLGTPKKGAALADIVTKLLPQVITGRIVLDLTTDNTYLQALHDAWTELRQTNKSDRFAIFCAFETEDVIGIPGVVGIMPVPEAHADTDCDGRAWPATGHDHLSIAAPGEIKLNNIYGWVRGRLVDLSSKRQKRRVSSLQLPTQKRLEEIQRKLEEKEKKTQSAKSPPEKPFEISRAIITETQGLLYELNYFDEIDGLMGPKTVRALQEFETDAQLVRNDGQLTLATLEALRKARRLAPWGAIVYSEGSGHWGASWEHSTRRAAVDAARSDCGGTCRLQLSIFGTDCAALAFSSKHWAMVAQKNVAEARKAAIDQCRANGNSCEIAIELCANGQSAPTQN